MTLLRLRARPHPACAAEAAPAAPKRQRGESARRRPGPLPREREEHWPRSWNTMPVDGPAVFEQRRNNAASASEPFELSRAVHNRSLSPGERAGVRANVLFLIAFLF